MGSRIAFFLFISNLIAPNGYGTNLLFPSLDVSMPAGEDTHDVCTELAPDPSTVTDFYEDNPAYYGGTPTNLPWQTGTPESQGMNSAVLQKGADALAKLPQPFSLLVMRNNVLVFEKYLNGSQASDSNNVHSSSKSIIGALVGIAIREGFLTGVNQPISDILSDKFKIKGTKQNITIQDMLTMSAGFKWTEDSTEYDIEDDPNWVQAILNLKLASTPGSAFNYCTGLTHTLSAIITESSGMSTCHFAKRFLFDPMGITFQHWGRDPQGYYSGGYNLYLRPSELMKFGMLYLQKGMWNGQSLVPSDWAQASWQPHIEADDPGDMYGYLWFLLSRQGQAIYKMWGYGGQFVYVVPSKNLIMVTTADTKQEYTELDGDTFLDQYVLSAIQ